MVGETGLEPARPYDQGFLRPLRLPITPLPHAKAYWGQGATPGFVYCPPIKRVSAHDITEPTKELKVLLGFTYLDHISDSGLPSYFKVYEMYFTKSLGFAPPGHSPINQTPLCRVGTSFRFNNSHLFSSHQLYLWYCSWVMTPSWRLLHRFPTTSRVANGLRRTYASATSKIVKVGLTLYPALTYGQARPEGARYLAWGVYDCSRSGEHERKDNSHLSRPCINII